MGFHVPRSAAGKGNRRSVRGPVPDRRHSFEAGFFLMSVRGARGVCLVVALLVWSVSPLHSQLRRPRADVATVVETDAGHAGAALKAAITVSLPEGLHVQSDRPRDPTLIPTVLTMEPPAGVKVEEIVYPPSTDLKQTGQDQPLAVFEREFAIG